MQVDHHFFTGRRGDDPTTVDSRSPSVLKTVMGHQDPSCRWGDKKVRLSHLRHTSHHCSVRTGRVGPSIVTSGTPLGLYGEDGSSSLLEEDDKQFLPVPPLDLIMDVDRHSSVTGEEERVQ